MYYCIYIIFYFLLLYDENLHKLDGGDE
jgi:hypothetical protein